MKSTLVIMVAGIGTRFSGEIKQLAPVGLNGEIIMDYLPIYIDELLQAGRVSVKVLDTNESSG